MEYFTERNGMRIPMEQTEDISVEMYSLLLGCCKRFYLNLAWKYPEKCPDGDICCALNMQQLLSELKFVIPNIYINRNGEIASPENSGAPAFGFQTPQVQIEFDQYALLDLIEFVAQNSKDITSRSYHDFFKHYDYFFGMTANVFFQFQEEVNNIFRITGLSYALTNDKVIERTINNSAISDEINNNISQVPELGIKERLQEAITLFKQPHPNSRKLAVEKIWDALERLKTYHANLDKKNSAEKIVTDMSNGQQEFTDLFNAEFKALTNIGNNFTIRHHEVNKTDILDEKHYDYFFNRCLSLIALAIQYLK